MNSLTKVDKNDLKVLDKAIELCDQGASGLFAENIKTAAVACKEKVVAYRATLVPFVKEKPAKDDKPAK